MIDSYEGQHDPSQPGLNLTPLLADPLRIALRSDQPPPRALSDLADAKWVLGGAHSRLGQATKAVLQTHGITPSILVESDDHGITFDVIGSIAAVTMLPALALRGAPPHVATVADIDLRRDRHIHLVTRVVPHPHPAFKALETALLHVASRISTEPGAGPAALMGDERQTPLAGASSTATAHPANDCPFHTKAAVRKARPPWAPLCEAVA